MALTKALVLLVERGVERRLSLRRVPHVCARGAIKALLPLHMHVNHVMLTPSQWTPCLRNEKVRVRVP
jgi:hypothetical protein